MNINEHLMEIDKFFNKLTIEEFDDILEEAGIENQILRKEVCEEDDCINNLNDVINNINKVTNQLIYIKTALRNGQEADIGVDSIDKCIDELFNIRSNIREIQDVVIST